jgi:hypothetical protein
LTVTQVSYTVDGQTVVGVPAGVSISGNSISVDPTHASFDDLSVGASRSIVVNYAIDDGHGGVVPTSKTISVTGTNDAPTITSTTNVIGEIKEDVTNPTLSDTGVIAFSDVDLIDVHSVSASKESGSLGGTLNFAAVSEDSGSEGGTVGWTYEVPNTSAQSLADGQSAV